ncbi:MAG: hypothetical protein IH794_11895 [Acidobacteria bacterium]|nr:hypothetical protein [Acidobacteriota bacterium]
MGSFKMDKREQALKIHSFRKRIVHEHGVTNAGCLLAVLALIVVGYGGYKFGPHFVDDYQLRNAAVKIADYAAAGVLAETKYGTGRGRGEIEEIREAVLVEAIDLRIPLSRDNILVEKEGGFVFITVKYMVPISLPWGEFNWNFEYTVNN